MQRSLWRIAPRTGSRPVMSLTVSTHHLLHVIPHLQRQDVSTKTVHNRRYVQFPIPTLHLSDVCQQLRKRSFRLKILLQQVLCRHRRWISFCQVLRLTLARVQPPVFMQDPFDPMLSSLDSALPECLLHSRCSVVLILRMFIAYLFHR